MYLSSVKVVVATSTTVAVGTTRSRTSHNLVKRYVFNELCKGNYDPSMFARLSRLCEECHILFNDYQVYNLCREDCFTSDYFKGCMDVLYDNDQEELFKTYIKTLHGHEPLIYGSNKEEKEKEGEEQSIEDIEENLKKAEIVTKEISKESTEGTEKKELTQNTTQETDKKEKEKEGEEQPIEDTRENLKKEEITTKEICKEAESTEKPETNLAQKGINQNTDQKTDEKEKKIEEEPVDLQDYSKDCDDDEEDLEEEDESEDCN